MVVNCVFCGKKKGSDKLSFHKFPLKYPIILEQWLQNMNLGSQFQPTASMKLCSNHFSKDVLKRVNSEEVLLPGSVPTIFNHYKSACVYCDAKKNDEKKRSFHVFPIEKPLLLEKWTKAMNLQTFTLSKQSFLCSDHFAESSFRVNKRNDCRRLNPNSVPSLFEPLSKKGDKRKNTLESEPSVKKLCRNDTDSMAESTNVKEYSGNNTPEKSTMELSVVDDAIVACNNLKSEAPEEDAETLPELGSSTPTVAKTASAAVNHSETPSLKRLLFLVTNDHNYEVSSTTAKRKLKINVLKKKKLQNDLRTCKQHIVRLKKKVASLKNVVHELRKSRAIPESGLDTRLFFNSNVYDTI